MRSLIIATTILAPAAASAGGYIIPFESPRELALSQASVADQNGAEAIFLNSSALAGQEGLSLQLSIEFLMNRTDWSDPTLGSSHMPTQFNTPPSFAVAYGAKLENKMPWGVGFGVNVPAGGSIQWPLNWEGQESIKSVKQLVFGINVGAALQPLPFLKIGASYIRLQATEELHQAINFLDRVGDAGLTMSGGANGWGVSAEIKVPDAPLTFGLNYIHGSTLDLEGDAHFTDVPPAFQVLLHDQAVTEELKIPRIFYVGAAYEAMPGLKVMASYNFEGWSVYEEDRFVGADGFVVAVPRNYNNAHVIRAAGEWRNLPAFKPLTLRAGALRSISDHPSETLSPSLTDASSWAISLGAGFDLPRNLRLDFSWQHAFFDEVTASGPEAFPGSYDTTVDLISFGVSGRFGV